MAKEIPLKLIVGTVSDEKGVSEDVIIEALQAALISATKKKYGSEIDVDVEIDVATGAYETFRVWTVVEQLPGQPLENPWTETSLDAARLENPNINVGDKVKEEMESVDFGRIAAQTAKQVIIQKVREAERELICQEYRKRIGELFNATVKRVTRDNIILDLGGNAEGLLKKSEVLPREAFRPGDRVKSFLVDVISESRGPQLIFSRCCPEMLVELFKIEVPEVGEGVIKIKGAARDPGQRAKVAVKTNDSRMDPIGACVGIRGARVQAISNELGGERIDIVLWDEDPAQFVMNAIAPAEVTSITVDDESGSMDIAVVDEFLSQAIGRNGQNVRLASKLTGWELNIVSDSDAKQQGDIETENIIELFVKELDVDQEVAEVLLREGFSSLEEIAYVPIQEMLEIEEFDEEAIKELRARAKEKVLAAVEQGGEQDLSLETLEGINDKLLSLFSENNIATRDDLAELAVDDLMQIDSELSEEEAANLIMAARSHWFNEQAEQQS